MARPNLSISRRSDLIPVVARAFAELGFRRATTAELAKRCGVQETILYRLWPDKRSMFIAAIDHVYEVAALAWSKVLASKGQGTSAERLLAYEAKHLGEFGYVRIVFAGLMEADDPQIRRALATMYRRYEAFVAEQVRIHRAGRRGAPGMARSTDRLRAGADPTSTAKSSARRGSTATDRDEITMTEMDDADLAAWALIGLGTIGSISRELRLLADGDRRRLLDEAGRRLLD